MRKVGNCMEAVEEPAVDDVVGGEVAAVGKSAMVSQRRFEGRYNSGMASVDIANLSLDERLRLLDELWESLSAKPEALPLTNSQREELDQRLDDLEREGPVGIPWDEVLGRIRQGSRRGEFGGGLGAGHV
jgi:putative addiction module component (TIGR02574 family)